MQRDRVMFSVTFGHVKIAGLVAICFLALFTGSQLWGQKVQEDFRDKFKVATDDGGIAIAASADGRYVYLVGKKGLIVSDDFGKTGSWVQTLNLK